MGRKHHPEQLGSWAKENGFWKIADAYHPESVAKRRAEGVKRFNDQSRSKNNFEQQKRKFK